MTYRELSGELGINSAYILRLSELGIIKKNGMPVLGSLSEEETLSIRKCCLFSMLGISPESYASVLNGNADFKETIKQQVDNIISDEDNKSQAAIVLQNIKRENTDLDSLDPEPYLQHVKELKFQGGIFYDINSLKPVENNENNTSRTENRKGIFARFLNPDTENPNVKNHEQEESDAQSFKYGEDGSKDPGSKNTGSDPQKTEEEKDTKEQGGTSSGPTGYDESWSPYTDRGFGASNMGSGNWHGWTPGYGTYAQAFAARERVNNGEVTCPHPIRRFAARVFDTTLVNLIGCSILRLVFRINTGLSLKTTIYCEMIFWAFSLLIEPILLTLFGTTPGKWIMGIRIRDTKTKGKLDIKKAYIRSLKLAWHGFGFMIPIFTLFKRLSSMMKCRMNDTLPWDDGIDVELTDETTVRLVLCVIGIVLLNFADQLVDKQAVIPVNRGEITREQFYENVAVIMKYIGYAGDIPNFDIKTQGGYVKSVSLKYTDRQYEENRYEEMYIGFMAFAGAADGSNGFKLMLASPLSRLSYFYSSFSEQYCGVTVMNESDSGIREGDNYNMLITALTGTEITMPPFNQTFTLMK